MAAEQKLTAEAFADWLTPRQALEILDTVLVKTVLSKQTLIDRLRGGMVQAVSNHSVFEGERNPHQLNLYKIPAEDWDQWMSSDAFWITGDKHYTYKAYGSGDRITARHFDVRFEPQGVNAMVALLAKSPLAPSPAQTPTGPRESDGTRIAPTGAPRKDWWDDFWIAICGAIYEGDLKPQRQADLERAMLDWATKHGHEVSEATIRKVAKKLFSAWKLGG
jgi:hypothetical protein